MTEPTTSELVQRLDRGGATSKEKKRAQVIARAFLRKHGIARQDCPCGFFAGIHMHHPDYKKPLEVMFLCPRCHVWEHTPGKGTWGAEYICDLTSMVPPPGRSREAFTKEQIKTIKSRFEADPRPETVKELADKFIVSEPVIRAIILVKRWKL